MFIEISLAILFGLICGIFTGLIPGIHINLVASFVFMILLQYSIEINLFYIAVFIVTLGITHSFIDFIPSLFLGVPSADTVVSMLPGHQLVQEGKGFEALHLTAWGSLGGVFVLFLIYIFAYFVIYPHYESISKHIGKILLFVILYLIFFEEDSNSKFWALIIVLLSGGFGMIVLNSLYVQNPLFLIFTGMFGTATLLISLLDSSESIPKQNLDENKIIFEKKYIGAIGLGGVSAMFCSILPGLGNAQAGTLAITFFRGVTAKTMIVILSSINTINFGLSLLTLYVLDRARNGAILILKQLQFEIGFTHLLILFLVILGVSIIAYSLTLTIGKQVIKITNSINIQIVNFVLIILLTSIVIFFSNINGFLAYVIATALGILCVQVKVKRVHLMSVLLIPIIIALW